MCKDYNYKAKYHEFKATLAQPKQDQMTISVVGWRMVWQRVSGRPWVVEVELATAKGRLKVMKA